MTTAIPATPASTTTNPIGCCTITWMFRPSDPISPEQRVAMTPSVLREIRELGFDGAEIGVHIEELGEVEGVQQLAAEHGLAVIRINSRAPLREKLHKMQRLGVAYIMAGTPQRKTFTGGKPSVEDLARLARELEVQAKISLEEYGLPTALHNHLWTAAETREEVSRLLDGAEHLRLLLDVAHLRGAGADPVQMIRDYGDRIVGVHVKDWDSTLYRAEPFHPGFVELGRGNCDLDVAGCLGALSTVGYGGWLTVEQDLADDPLASNRHNREYLRALGY